MVSFFSQPSHPVLLVGSMVDHSIRRPLPFLIHLGVSGLQLKQWTWWMWYRRKVYNNPSNFLPLAGGYLLERFLKDNKIVLLISKIILIFERIEECRLILSSLNKEWRCLMNVFSRKDIPLPNFFRFSSFPARLTWKSKLHNKVKHWQCFLNRVWEVCQRIFTLFAKLSFTLWDTYECLYSPVESIREIFVNGKKWSDLFNQKKTSYLAKLHKNKKILFGLFEAMQIQTSEAEMLIEEGQKLLHHAFKAAQMANKLSCSDLRPRKLLKAQALGKQRRLVFKSVIKEISAKPAQTPDQAIKKTMREFIYTEK